MSLLRIGRHARSVLVDRVWRLSSLGLRLTGARSLALQARKDKESYVEQAERYSRMIEDDIRGGRKPPVQIFRALANALRQLDRVKHSFELLELMKAEGMPPDTVIVADVMAMLARRGEEKSVLNMYTKFTETGGLPNLKMFEVLALFFAKRFDTMGIRNLFPELVRYNVSPNEKIYRYYIDSYVKTKDVNAAENVYDYAVNNVCRMKPPITLLLSMMKIYYAAGAHTKLLRMYESMTNYGREPTAECQELVILSYGAHGGVKQARNLLDEICRTHVEKKEPLPRAVVGAMLATYAKLGLLKEARELFHRIPKLTGSLHNAEDYNTLLLACDKAGKYATIAIELNRMKAANLQPNYDTYLLMIEAASRREMFADVRLIYEQMRKAGIERKEKCISIPLAAAARQLNTHWTKFFLREQKIAEFDPDDRVKAAFAYAQTMQGEFQGAQAAVHDLINKEPAIRAIMNACVDLGEYDRMTTVYEDMKAAGIRPSRSTLKVLMDGYEKGRDIVRLSKTLSEYQALGYAPDAKVLSKLIQAYLATGNVDKVIPVLEQMNQNGVAMDVLLYDRMNGYLDAEGVRGRISAGQVEKLRELIIKMAANIQRLQIEEKKQKKIMPSQLFSQETLSKMVYESAPPKIEDAVEIDNGDPEEIIKKIKFY